MPRPRRAEPLLDAPAMKKESPMAVEMHDITIHARNPGNWRFVSLVDGATWEWEPDREPSNWKLSTLPDWVAKRVLASTPNEKAIKFLAEAASFIDLTKGSNFPDEFTRDMAGCLRDGMNVVKQLLDRGES